MKESQATPKPSKWPTLADRCKTWSGTCDKCGEPYPADTRINALWNKTSFFISCKCSPRDWVLMETA